MHFFLDRGLAVTLSSAEQKKNQTSGSGGEICQQGSDEFSVNSLPIQDSDIESIEQTWNHQQEEVSNRRQKHSTRTSRKYSTQTYSDRGVTHSSLHGMNKPTSNIAEDCSSLKSIGTASFGDGSHSGFAQTASKTRATARRVPSRRLSPHNESESSPSSSSELSTVINGRGQATSEKDERKERSSRNGPPRPKSHRRSNSRRSSSKSSASRSTKDRHDSESVSSHASNSSSNDTSASKLEKEMFRLSLELASTLADLDVSKMEINKYQKQIKNLEDVVKKLLEEKAALTQRLLFHEEKVARKTSMMPGQDAPDRLCHDTDEAPDIPACITPSKGNGSADLSDSEEHNESRDLLFPDLNESHLSCSGLYGSPTDGKGNDNDKNEFDPSTSIDLVDPKDEVFDDDPFATFNYSSDNNNEEVADDVGSTYDLETIDKTVERKQPGVDTISQNTSQGVINFGMVANQFRNRRNQQPVARRNRIPDGQSRKHSYGKECIENDDRSHISMRSHQDIHQKVNNSRNTNRLNISRILKFGKEEKNENRALSVSIHSTQSNHSLGSLLEVFGRKRHE